MKIASVVGARPNFVKLAAVHEAITSFSEHVIIHTGQHYDYSLSEIFFKEFNLPKPEVNLGVGSGPAGTQIGEMLKKLQKILREEKNRFDALLVYGDTNSTFAGALCASRSGIKVAHVEAGLRSFDISMPEESNRILTDHLSDFLFAPTSTAVKNLKRENVRGRVILTGDVSVEILNYAIKKLVAGSLILDHCDLKGCDYVLMTIHRAENTNSKERMISLIRSFEILSGKLSNLRILFPIHPRTAYFLRRVNLYPRLKKCKNVQVIKPVGFIDFVALMKNAKKIVTDSGGVQKESYLLGIPCVTARSNTEWVETVEIGANILTGTNTGNIVKAVKDWDPPSRVFTRKAIFGDGRASEKIKDSLMKSLKSHQPTAKDESI